MNIRRLCAALLLTSALGSSALAAESYDLVIKGGRVIDPASGRDAVTDVGLNGGKIAAIGDGLAGKRVLDAKGMVVSPGFIDVHEHGQNATAHHFQILDGVTTSIDMEIGALPIADFFKEMQGKSLINYGASAAHLCARIEVLSGKICGGHAVLHGALTMDTKSLTTPATEEQEEKIASALDREIAAGALGYGIGLEYAPGTGRREMFRIFQHAAQTKAPIFVHLRVRQPDRAPGVPIAVAQEMIADAAATGASLQIVHIVSTAQNDAWTVLDLIKGARKHGVDVTTEMYPYIAGSTLIGSELFSDGWQERQHITYSDLLYPGTGKRLTEETFKEFRSSKPDSAVVIFANPPAAVDMAIADPTVMIASDGMPWVTSREHPRGAGTFSKVLGEYVRDRKLLDLKTALAKMTIMPARRLEQISAQMTHKGRLEVGADADVTVFDPAKIKDQATFEKPMQASVGVRYVIVGGQLMAKDGAVTENLFPGVAIRSGT